MDEAILARERVGLTRLFGGLDPDHDGLGPALDAWHRGRVSAACRALAEYYEGRSIPGALLWCPRLGAAEHRRLADGVLRGEFELQGLAGRPRQRADGGIDWRHRGPRGDPEWARFLNRHDFFRSLLRAWQQTGAEPYRGAINRHLLHWLRSVPRPRHPSWGGWRSLEAARRCTLPWMEVFYCREPRSALDPEARVLMLASIIEHGRVLRRWHARSGNHRLTELVALTVLAVAWPEIRAAAGWLDYGARRATAALLGQTYPDGAHVELSNHYQRVVLAEAERLLCALQLAGREPALLRARVRQMWEFFAGVTRPDGQGPLNNDGDLEPNAEYLADAAQRHEEPGWRYVASAGLGGAPPAGPPSRYYPYSGQAIMRSGWHRDAHWARFDMGPHGTDHQHADQLSLELYAGEMFLIDPGRYTYRRGAERAYFRGAVGHNVLRLDGDGSTPPPQRAAAPRPGAALRTERFDYFSQSARFGRRASWTRSVLYLRGGYWVVADGLTLAAPGTVTASWAFHPRCEVHEIPAPGLLARTAGSALAMIAAGPQGWEVQRYRGSRGARMRGWYSETYNQIEPCDQFEFRRAASGALTAGWVLYPLAAGCEEIPRVEPGEARDSVDGEPRGLRLRVTWAGVEDAIEFLAAASDPQPSTSRMPCTIRRRHPDGRIEQIA